MKTDGSAFTTLATMPGINGNPSTLLLDSDGMLYGTTLNGGPEYTGSLFTVNPQATGATTLYTFSRTDGRNPVCLIRDGSHALYGVGRNGGANEMGSIFSINTDGSGITVLYSFDGTDGDAPAGLLLTSNRLYGVTNFGGANGYGNVYSVKTDGKGFIPIYSFSGLDGNIPSGSLLEPSPGGPLYGVTGLGGQYGDGNLYSVMPDGSDFTTLFDFDIYQGKGEINPYETPTLGSDGNLYVVTYAGGFGTDKNCLGTGAVSVTLTMLPIIESFSPKSGASGTTVTIKGVNLSSASSVAFNGVAATIVNDSSTLITVTVPSGATTGPIAVTTSNGADVSTQSFKAT